MKPHRSFPQALLFGLAVLAASAPALLALPPHIGYIYPAGIQRGTTCEITVGGQFLEGTTEAIFSGSGLKATVLRNAKLLNGKRWEELNNYLKDARKKAADAKESPAKMSRFERREEIKTILKASGATDDEIKAFLLRRNQERDPKQQKNAQLSETVTLQVEAAPDAPTGAREARLHSPAGLSNPLTFCVGSLAETRKPEPAEKAPGDKTKTPADAPHVTLPVVLNGQIHPGEIDHYAFSAARGARIVVAVQARDLIPYLADAVPGWFQPVVALYDAKGREVAYANAYRFNPDPVFCYEVPETGLYTMEVRDALYRGREDFVYRVSVGSIPFVTGVFPLGAPVGEAAAVDVSGWNLPRTRVILPPSTEEGVSRPADLSNGFAISDVSFAADPLPEITEKEPNNGSQTAQAVKLPVIVNGRIDPAGDVDQFTFSCKAGEKVVAEVEARRLNSPLDSWLRLTDRKGRQLAFNDDQEDKGAGLLTHQADSRIVFTAPADGVYHLELGDAQHKGGPEYGYRLRMSAPRPDFALRWVPSAINGRPGMAVPVTVYALRKDGFAGDIALTLKEAPNGFSIQGGVIPAGQDKIQATVTFPPGPLDQPARISVEGRATVDGREIHHPAVPADDLLQAFAYHHLVPAQAMLVAVSGTSRTQPLRLAGSQPLVLSPGGTGRVVVVTSGRFPKNPAEIKFQLLDAPEGIAVENVASVPEGVALTLRVAAKVKPGLAGNLLLEAFGGKTPPTPAGKKAEKKQRWSLGTLPAIPFKITAPATH